MRAWVLVIAGCGSATVRASDPVPESPGVVFVEGGSRTFERSIELYRSGEWREALVTLDKVVQSDSGDNSSVRWVAVYDSGTICLEHGLYTNAFTFYDSLANSDYAPVELRSRTATALAIFDERVRGATTMPIDDALSKLGIPRATLRPSRADQLVADWSRWSYEHELLAKSMPAWWKTTPVAFHFAEDLEYYWKSLVAECARERVECTAAQRWIPRPTPTPVAVQTITVTSPAPQPTRWHSP